MLSFFLTSKKKDYLTVVLHVPYAMKMRRNRFDANWQQGNTWRNVSFCFVFFCNGCTSFVHYYSKSLCRPKAWGIFLVWKEEEVLLRLLRLLRIQKFGLRFLSLSLSLSLSRPLASRQFFLVVRMGCGCRVGGRRVRLFLGKERGESLGELVFFFLLSDSFFFCLFLLSFSRV